MKKSFCLLLCILLPIIGLNGQRLRSIPNPKTQDRHTYVSNPDLILTPETETELNRMLDNLEQETSSEVAVVAVHSIGDDDIKVFATDLFEYWGIGKSEQDNGFLILFVMNQRKITFETGYGLEGILPDAVCKRIQMQDMVPCFKDGDYNRGILAGTERIVSIIKKEPGTEFYNKPKASRGNVLSLLWKNISSFFWIYILFIFAPYLMVANIIRKARKNRNLSNIAKSIVISQKKNKTIGLLSLLGFVIGILILVYYGSVGDLFILLIMPLLVIPANIYGKIKMKKIKNEPVFCSECENEMRLLSKKEEKVYLATPQIVEEKIRSILYDIYYCNKCKKANIYKFEIKSKYKKCPKCENRTFGKGKTVTVNRATSSETGLRIITYNCKVCNYQEKEKIIIPRLQSSSSSSSRSSDWGSSSSDSSSSGGSFGGGRSGGGGATSSW